MLTEMRKIVVTPEVAEILLGFRPSIENDIYQQRRVRTQHVDFLAREMRAGRWADLGEPLMFDINKKLVDGQHRLLAVIKSGVTIEFYVKDGIKIEDYVKINVGKARSTSDVLTGKGFNNPQILSGAVTILWRYELNAMKSSSTPSPAEVIEFVSVNNGVFDSIRIIRTLSEKNAFMSRVKAAAMHYAFSCIEPQLANTFFTLLFTGENLSTGSPILLLRNRLIENSRSKKTKMRGVEVLALIVIAWNCFLRGQKLSCLKWNSESDFPQILLNKH
jgi:hypothetical protein